MPKAPAEKARARAPQAPRASAAPRRAAPRNAPRTSRSRPAAAVSPSLPPPPPLPGASAGGGASGVLLLAVLPGLLLLGVVALCLGLLVPGALLVVLSSAVLLCGLLLCTPARCLAALGGRPALEPDDARLINLVEGLCVAIGLPVPGLVVLEDPAANAIVLGTSPAHATLICTSGALRLLDRMELEGLVAHELAHLKRGDTRAAALAMSFLGGLALVVPHPGRLLRRVGDPAREAAADLLGSAITRYPPGLRQALEKLATAPITRPAGVNPRLLRLTGTFWCAPLERDDGAPLVAGVLDLELRVGALSEL